MRKYSKRSLDNLRGIHPALRRVVDRALQDSPLDFVVIEGLRTEERQRELVREGKSRTMNSRHLTGHAVDLLPIDPATGKGAFDWDLYNVLGPAVEAAARAEGVEIDWGGRWKSFKDGPHFELDRKAYPVGADPLEPVLRKADRLPPLAPPVDYVVEPAKTSLWARLADLIVAILRGGRK